MEMFIYWRTPNMAWLLVAIFFTVSPSTSTRILSHQPPPPRGGDRAITFFMNDVLGTSRPAAGTGAPPPIAKPMGGRPPATAAFAGQTGPPNKSWLPLLTSLHASALESGTVTMIDETLRGSVALGPPTAGKVQGMYVTSTGDNSSHMVAMKATFEDGRSDDSLRFFGVHHLGLPESHIAVVGGTGRYHGANGFAAVRATGSRESADGVLSVTVYLE
ncbi:dirigent protein 16-like [Phoenix dactylifera]|uniref:Dirigent protein n=1 Tax=Phoenix dactylifera TaxID=42345 RepID=A0A8B7BRB6_PHODC|nr:dirigent protein 16-like [Phoenix dactylifera]